MRGHEHRWAFRPRTAAQLGSRDEVSQELELLLRLCELAVPESSRLVRTLATEELTGFSRGFSLAEAGMYGGVMENTLMFM